MVGSAVAAAPTAKAGRPRLPRPDQVAGQLGEVGIVGSDRFPQRTLDPLQIGRHCLRLQKGIARGHAVDDRGAAPSAPTRRLVVARW